MRDKIFKLGRTKLVLVITGVSIFLAVTFDAMIAGILHHNLKPKEDHLRVAIIALLIAPIISWYLVGLLFELFKLENRLTRLVAYDELTGLFNRRAFYDSCDALHKYSIRAKRNYSILSVDLDDFKKINDDFGHASGDVVLSSFGEISNDLSRESDIVARFGGEEFVFFLPDTDLTEAEKFAKRLCKKIRMTNIVVDNSCIEYTVSIGIATNECIEDIALEEILKYSDKALYLAKNNGRNQIVMY